MSNRALRTFTIDTASPPLRRHTRNPRVSQWRAASGGKVMAVAYG